jgi:phage shock protein A
MILNVSFFVELTLIALLAATLVYCALLERRLSALRKGQDGLKATIGELNTAIVSAGASMRALKAAASDAATTLDSRIANARSLADELSLLTVSGDRIANRIADAAPAKPTNGIHPASLMNRLKPQAMGAIR